jgi:hypothetical protein
MRTVKVKNADGAAAGRIVAGPSHPSGRYCRITIRDNAGGYLGVGLDEGELAELIVVLQQELVELDARNP